MSRLARATAGLLLLAILTGGGVSLVRSGIYGLTVFIMFPVILGELASWVFRPKTAGRAAVTGAFAVLCGCLSFLVFGKEGFICIGMTLPLAMPLGALGAWLMYRLDSPQRATNGVVSIMLLLPVSLTFDTRAQPPVYEVHTAITIAASPDRVWKQVVTFSELPDPPEWYFRAGIGYPKRARYEGSGPGATRYCEFSTGQLVEPVQIWDEPRLLQFRVTENPPPLQEWSPYGRLAPKHLHGYLISKQGQFRLTRLPDNHTLLEGTTWYQHGLWPSAYWRLWSDAIIHRIHLRVLKHIQESAERPVRLLPQTRDPPALATSARQLRQAAQDLTSPWPSRNRRCSSVSAIPFSGASLTLGVGQH
jgi:hypothetical protein